MKKIIISLFAVCFAWSATAFDYQQIKAGEFVVCTVSGVRPTADGNHYTTIDSGKICRYAYSDGKLRDVMFNATDHKEVGSISDYALSADERKILLISDKKPIYRRSYSAKHWVWDIATKTLTPLTADGAEQIARFAPDGKSVAFMRNNNLYMVNLQSLAIDPITYDGEFNHIINGHTDWVNEEEFGYTRAYEFSPDGTKIAFLRFDESSVPQFTMMRYGDGNYPQPYTFKYPKAGEENAVVEVRIYDIASKTTTNVEGTGQRNIYVPRIGWTPHGELYIYKVNRLQNTFELLLTNGVDKPRIIYSEVNDRYIERLTASSVRFLADGKRFIVRSERDGYMHLYLCSVDSDKIEAVTEGEWEVGDLIDVVGDKVYYTSNEASVLGCDLYSIELNGHNKRRMSGGDGTYRVAPSKGFKYYIQYFSNIATPMTVTLHRADGSLVRILEDNAKLKERVARGDVPKKEFFTFTTERADTLNGYVLRPVAFDPAKKYPVMMTQYSGPGSQSVTDSWSIDWCDVLTEKGYVVVCVDGRGTGGRGEEFRKSTYGQLGKLEVEDQISAARWLSAQEWVDDSRIGIYGWSYGGFMSLGCMFKGNDLFKMGIAVAPVTSWRYYDSIYTEIYNGLPQDNASGYDENSPVNYARNLKGKLLIIHGTGDDNVHIQNSYAMISALVRESKQFDTAAYVDDNHSMRPRGAHHVRERMIEYTLNNL